MDQICSNCRHWRARSDLFNHGECLILDAPSSGDHDGVLLFVAPDKGSSERHAFTEPKFGCNKFVLLGPFSVRLTGYAGNPQYATVCESEPHVELAIFNTVNEAEKLARRLNRLWSKRNE